MTDAIADMLTRIRNAGLVKKVKVSVPATKMTEALAKVIRQNGYINDYRVKTEGKRRLLEIDLRYVNNLAAISDSKRESRPSRRVYVGVGELPRVLGGKGMAIVSTTKGIMTSEAAKKQNLGGELICSIW